MARKVVILAETNLDYLKITFYTLFVTDTPIVPKKTCKKRQSKPIGFLVCCEMSIFLSEKLLYVFCDFFSRASEISKFVFSTPPSPKFKSSTMITMMPPPIYE